MKATIKLAKYLAEYLFEQEYGELRSFSSSEVNKIKEVLTILRNKIK